MQRQNCHRSDVRQEGCGRTADCEGTCLMAAYTHTEAVSFIWSVADIIRDAGYHQSDYGDVILPFTVLRRLDQASQQT